MVILIKLTIQILIVDYQICFIVSQIQAYASSKTACQNEPCNYINILTCLVHVEADLCVVHVGYSFSLDAQVKPEYAWFLHVC